MCDTFNIFIRTFGSPLFNSHQRCDKEICRKPLPNPSNSAFYAEKALKRLQIYATGRLTWVRASHVTPYGKVISNWKLADDTLTMEITVPPNTTATVHVPAASAAGDVVTESGQPLAQAEGVKFLRMENGHAVCTLQSGSYKFEAGQ
jgi:hypothetical protein